MHGPSSPHSSNILGLMTFLTGSRILKYNKYLPKNRVRNVLAIGLIESIGYCVRESCQVSFVKGELC